MSERVTRDWRGIKFHLGECTAQELIDMATNAQHTYDQIIQFINAVDVELIRRGEITEVCVA
jgi:hypothetical protein